MKIVLGILSYRGGARPTGSVYLEGTRFAPGVLEGERRSAVYGVASQAAAFRGTPPPDPHGLGRED